MPPAERDRGRLLPEGILLGAGLLLLLPIVLLSRNRIGPAVLAFTWVEPASEALCLVAALLLGLAAAGPVLRARSRTTIAVAALVAPLVVAGAVVMSNLAPPPYPASSPPAGVPTPNGLLNAVYLVLILGPGAAALRLTAAYLRRARRDRAARNGAIDG